MSIFRLNVLLIESDEIGWTAVRQTLHSIPDAQIVDAVRDRSAVIQRALAIKPDVIIAAWRLEDESIIPLLRQLRPELPDATLIVLADGYDIDELLALGDIGISGYLLWRSLLGLRLKARLHAALWHDAVVVTSEVVDAYLLAQRRRWNPSDDALLLSERERMVLRLIAEGLTQRAIANQLDVHPRTIEATIAKLKQRLGANSEANLCVQAMRRGLLT